MNTSSVSTYSGSPPPTLLEVARVLRETRRLATGRGVTLIEVLIVVAIMALIATGVSVFALPKFREAQVSTARTAAQTIRSAVQQWQMSNNEVSCPTVSQLVQEKHIDVGSETNDPWGNPYSLTCTEDEVIVSSRGADKKKGTADDIVVPKGSPSGAADQT